MSVSQSEEISSDLQNAAHESVETTTPGVNCPGYQVETVCSPTETLMDAPETPDVSAEHLDSQAQPSNHGSGNHAQDTAGAVNQGLSVVSTGTFCNSRHPAGSSASSVNTNTDSVSSDHAEPVSSAGTVSESLTKASPSTSHPVIDGTSTLVSDEASISVPKRTGVSEMGVALGPPVSSSETHCSYDSLHSVDMTGNRTHQSLVVTDSHLDQSLVQMIDNSTEQDSASMPKFLEESMQQDNSSANQQTFSSSQCEQAQAFIGPVAPASHWTQNDLNSDQVRAFIGPIAPASHGAQSDLNSEQAPEAMDVDQSYDKKNDLHQAQRENFDFSNQAVPTFVTWCAAEYLKHDSENFLRGCKWSPNGSQVLTNSNDNILRIFNMSEEVTENEASSDIEQISEVVLRESGSVYDYTWHPVMRGMDTCRVATTCSGIPIHLWDAAAGKIVGSYKAFDQYDEVTSAYSLSFNPSGCRLFGGYKKSIRVFDTEYPGKKCQLVKTCGPKKSWSQPSQPGIISCFAHSLVTEGFFAAGSYTRHIGLYDLRCEGLTCVMEGQRGGITHLMFSPDGNKLFTGARKDNEILCWDVRNLGALCFSALRDVRTNQRMYFDITRSGRYMTSGNDDGTVTFWDLSRPTEEINGRTYLKPEAQYQAHADSVNGVSFHPSGNLLATASGQRHFRTFDKCDSGSNSSESDSDNDEASSMTWDFSLKVWRMPLAQDTAR